MSEGGAEKSDNHIYLVDGSGFIFRAFHALPPMNRPDGTPTNAVFGFTNMLLKLVEELEANHLAVIFDTARKTFRNDFYPDYKAHRPPAPEELVPQFDIIRQAVRAFNVPSLEMHGYEADDLIATYARQAQAKGYQVTIVSSDKDLMQLVGDGITMLDPMKNRSIGVEEVIEKFGVGPDKVVEVQALAGDSVDNVPGVPGIGVKTAAQLITEYGDLDTLLDRAGEIKQPKRREKLIENADLARVSRDLVRLKDDVEVEEPLESLNVRELDKSVLLDFLREQSFKRLIARFEAELGEESGDDDQGENLLLDEVTYDLVQTMDALQGWVDKARSVGTVAMDTETTSLDAMVADLVGVSLSVEPGHACYIPLRHTSGAAQGTLDLGGVASDDKDAPEQVPFDQAIALLKDLFEDPAVLKVAHNVKYDALVLANEKNGGIAIGPVDDTMSLSYVLEGGMHGHGLDELSRLQFDHQNIKFEEVCGKGKTQIKFSEVALDKALDYAAEDADMAIRLHRLLRPQLIEASMTNVYETLERPLIQVLTGMEREGIKVDPQILRDMSADFAKRMEELAVEIYQLAGEEFNIGSPKQLGEILFEKMAIPGGKKTKTGAFQTGADVLEDLAAQGHELPTRILEWRQLSKLKSTYTDALVEQINPDTGRVHTSYSMVGASTGRLSSNDPNLQNIPIRTEEGRKIRTAFVPEPGNKLISIDYSQIELRLVADIAGLESLRQAFLDGLDIHAQTASEVFGIPLAEMDGETRRKAKAINFGIIYGISGYGLARQLHCSPGEAKAYIDAYFEKYPGIKDYMDSIKAFCREKGYVETKFGRKIHIGGIRDSNQAKRGFSERAAINAPIQGTAADVIKRAMIRVPKRLKSEGLAARMLLTVHDELLFETPEAEIEATIAAVRDVMENAHRPAVEFSVPLVAEAGIGMSWAEAH